MKYFVAAYELVTEDEEPAELGEIVMPDFSPGSSGFLSLETFRSSPGAMVMDLDRDPDEIFEKLKAHYPGIPEKLLQEWFTETMVAADKLKNTDVVYSASVSDTGAKVMDPLEQKSYDVWVGIDPTKFLR